MNDFTPLTNDNELTCLECGSVNTAMEETVFGSDYKLAHCIDCDAEGGVRHIQGREPRMAVDADNFALLTMEGVEMFQEDK